MFFFTFLVFPNILFSATSSNPSIKNWGTVLMIIVSGSEVAARILNTLNLKVLSGLITPENVLYFCLFDYVTCIVPLLPFLALRGHIYMAPLTMDIINGIFYGLLAFNLGFMFITHFAFSSISTC